MKKIKISELPVVSSLIGLFTIGVDSQNRSVAVSLEFVQEAADAANTATKATDTAREAIVTLFESLIPSGLTVTAPQRITQGNLAELFIKAHLTPEGVAENVVFISDNRSISVAPDGRVTVLGRGISTVHIVPTLKTALAKSIPVEVVAPACRLNTASSLRFTQAGGFRLT